MKIKVAVAGVAAGVLALGLSACGGDAEGSDSETISIVGFAVPEAANKAIAEEFADTEAGDGVEFKTSYGPSGDQSRAVADGLDADYVHFSVATDVDRLVEADLVDPAWDQGENKGIVSTSVVVLGVREGNPKDIQGWDDLVEPGVGIVTANPASSGAARWNALAAWGHVTENGGTEEEATAFVDKLFANVVSLTNSGRDATTSFLQGNGDVLLAYENEAILAAQNGEGFEYVIPETTLLIENAGAILEDAPPVAQDWLDFVLSEEGQRQFALTGFRPVNTAEPGTVDWDAVGLEPADIEGAPDPADPFPAVANLLTLEGNFGGGDWSAVADKLFGDGEDGNPLGIVTEAIAKSGKASS
ncbi:sulfate ABC transporter substrate-binding protein [Nocardioides sp. IC4_145]|uniref:sulfate ABC transporter substrate-binding protein n=1 Tax=Nocardioides sp. IC4_145 TaxID=2714037 RepID=UPI001407AA2A|nr:sulfate ABC transporter substrate-binding protein [Nocardioides sp. IC4_145]NHC25165.1 sulfate ABC transporter substrate-binding protein [Nocardioides sp. IC4_145]